MTTCSIDIYIYIFNETKNLNNSWLPSILTLLYNSTNNHTPVYSHKSHVFKPIWIWLIQSDMRVRTILCMKQINICVNMQYLALLHIVKLALQKSTTAQGFHCHGSYIRTRRIPWYTFRNKDTILCLIYP